jgi:putative oxidoreductase
MSMTQIIFGAADIKSGAANFGLMVTRIFAGLTLALAHGIHKIPPSDKFIDGVGDLGFPVPLLFAWLAAFSELFGGILLALGLATRPVAFMISVTMGVAAFMQHANDPFATKEMALLFLSVSTLFLFVGAGNFAVDKAFRK